ncbi:MAG: ketose-bisphosphate aldolase [Chloroflexi bacterium]|nr:ketose-bisphosphate aldolase [Chloroflexota bacterium]MCY3583952.1 ketose-bisphosphate aldolase [Chloroflexota bacterium]MCY3716081.1 ketose-bisphosphate aldolase [Chloroflexota bacterium]MDE2651402.1 ketose-bisphosphate aldolase [Chloroflexota bacterium]MXV93072.1 ketose-bisphosphate aldolase [Chloroflexota bacterium]
MLLNMKDLLSVARAHNFAVPAYNISSSMLLRGALEAAEEAQAPVIIAIHPDELAFVGTAFVQMALAAAIDATVPVVVHLDHGSSMQQIMTAIRAGFTSVMIDASELPLEENIAACREVTTLAHLVNISVEGELGTIGELDEEAEAGAEEVIFVKPEEVKHFIDATQVDTLAVSIGTSHGLYPKDMKPEIRLDLLRDIRAIVDTPLVLHGGSGNPDEEIAQAVALGINKINISADMKSAFYRKAREVLADPILREPSSIYPECIAAMKVVCRQKFDLFSTTGKAALY